MLQGYRGLSKDIYDWDWIPEEIISLKNSDHPVYYPKYKIKVKQNDRLLEIPNKAFIYFKDIDFINKHAKLQISVFNSLHLKIDDVLKESINYGFNILHLNRIYGFIQSESHNEIEVLKRAGFQKEGVIPDHLFWNSETKNREIWGLLSDGYNNKLS